MARSMPAPGPGPAPARTPALRVIGAVLCGVAALVATCSGRPKAVLLAQSVPSVAVVDLRARPVIVRAGDEVEVTGTLVNGTAHELREVALSVAVSSASAERVDFDAASPGAVVNYASVPAGGEQPVKASVRLLSPGSPSLSLAGSSDLGMIPPREGVRVRVIAGGGDLLVDVARSFALYLVLLVGAYYAVRALLSGDASVPRVRPVWQTVVSGVAVCLAAPMVAAAVAGRVTAGDAVAVWFGVLLGTFGLGWVTIAAGVRPRGGVRAAVGLAAAGYVAVGVFWLVLVDTFVVGLTVHDLLRGLLDPYTAATIFWWPVQVVQYAGVPGLLPR